jgi:DNA-binding Xre family transcriptional regulator
MSDLYKRIEDLCKERGTNITEMCKASGAARGSLTDLKMGRISRLNTTTLSRIAEHFSVTVGYLLGHEETKKPADQKADGLRGLGYYDLTPENQKMIDALIDSLLKSQSGEQ